MKKPFFLLLALLFPAATSAAIYKCEVGGKVSFTDEPCGDAAERVQVDAPPKSGMRLDTGTDIETYQPSKLRKKESKPTSCAYINSTELKTLIIKERLKTGMKPEHVRKSWGAPTSINTSSGSVQWAYHWPTGNSNYVYFKDGCVSNFSSYVRNY
ncbi:DUF4124 domain-containing protein [Marinobacter sp. chi1]|uniref:DUF4124 domain-containing protein n=1 Tax=Marinobacter suaedae TaxID=3057675 RepID=A0ABT8W1W4_9GAMM|nr:DUF4124 domain-containing protein [Marinobacter sp. chi1]MDO3722238.1 DUF4124 domain-containing protein [Marinobacter sp. chi1]